MRKGRKQAVRYVVSVRGEAPESASEKLAEWQAQAIRATSGIRWGEADDGGAIEGGEVEGGRASQHNDG